MSDLISRSALITEIDRQVEELQRDGRKDEAREITLEFVKASKKIINNQPTAYDVEMVCAKIKRRSGNGYRDIDGDYVPPMIETKDVIEIIRKGGVNE